AERGDTDDGWPAIGRLKCRTAGVTMAGLCVRVASLEQEAIRRHDRHRDCAPDARSRVAVRVGPITNQRYGSREIDAAAETRTTWGDPAIRHSYNAKVMTAVQVVWIVSRIEGRAGTEGEGARS